MDKREFKLIRRQERIVARFDATRDTITPDEHAFLYAQYQIAESMKREDAPRSPAPERFE